MELDRVAAGRSFDGEPDWRPLENLAPENVDEFMWMFGVKTEDGERIEVYKHCETRRYLHLDGRGAAYVYTDDDRYKQVGAAWLLGTVLRQSLWAL